MSKTITSPVKRWPGTVVLSDPLNPRQALIFLEALTLSRGLEKDAPFLEHLYTLLPGVLACVENFSLAGLPEKMTMGNFPATPGISAARLAGWLNTEVASLWAEEADESPNKSGPPPTDG